MMLPIVTIITPSYNSEEFIRETILSVESQDYPNIEHIIIDGASQDNTINVIKEFPRLRWVSEPDNGQSNAINKGLKKSCGEIIGWLNADDIYKPLAVSNAIKFLVDHPNIAAVYGDMEMVNAYGELISVRRSKPFDLSALFLENYINQPTVFVRKWVLDQLGGVNEELHYSMDRELWLRIGSRFQMQYLSGWVGARFRLHAASKTCTSEAKFHGEWRSVLELNLNNQFYQNVPFAIRQRAIEQAGVRQEIALIREEIQNRAFSKVFNKVCRLVFKHRKYIFNYWARKLS